MPDDPVAHRFPRYPDERVALADLDTGDTDRAHVHAELRRARAA